jgi:phage-related protein
MARCWFYDYVELTGRKPVREWLTALPGHDKAKIDLRLQHIEAMPLSSWSDKWVSKYRGTELFELRISGKKIEYRPLGVYFGQGKFVILAGAIEKGDKLKKSDVEVAEQRLRRLREDARHARAHEFDDEEDEGDLEEDAQ